MLSKYFMQQAADLRFKNYSAHRLAEEAVEETPKFESSASLENNWKWDSSKSGTKCEEGIKPQEARKGIWSPATDIEQNSSIKTSTNEDLKSQNMAKHLWPPSIPQILRGYHKGFHEDPRNVFIEREVSFSTNYCCSVCCKNFQTAHGLEVNVVNVINSINSINFNNVVNVINFINFIIVININKFINVSNIINVLKCIKVSNVINITNVIYIITFILLILLNCSSSE